MFAHLPYLSAVEANVRGAQDYYRRVQSLPTVELLPETNKHNKKINKILRANSQRTIEMYERLVKYSDVAALTVMSQPKYKLYDYNDFKRNKHQLTESVLVRGIAAGPIVDYVREQGLDYYFIETGYFGNYKCKGNENARKNWHRIVKNSMQHESILAVPDDRWRRLLDYDER